MRTETLVSLGATVLPICVAIGGTVNWFYRLKRQKQSDADLIVAEEKAADGVEFTRLRSSNADLDRQLRELTPLLAEIRREYTEAVQQCMGLLDQLRHQAEETNQITVVWVAQRLELTAAIKSQNEYILILRAKMTEAGLVIPASPDFRKIIDQYLPLEGHEHE